MKNLIKRALEKHLIFKVTDCIEWDLEDVEAIDDSEDNTEYTLCLNAKLDYYDENKSFVYMKYNSDSDTVEIECSEDSYEEFSESLFLFMMFCNKDDK